MEPGVDTIVDAARKCPRHVQLMWRTHLRAVSGTHAGTREWSSGETYALGFAVVADEVRNRLATLRAGGTESTSEVNRASQEQAHGIREIALPPAPNRAPLMKS